MSSAATISLTGYAFPALPLAFAALPLYVHLPPFYAQHTGLGLGLLGLLLLAARFLDALLDPLWGWWVDRQGSQTGGRSLRGLLMFALVPFALGFSGLFLPPAGLVAQGEHLIALWLLAGLLLTYVSFSLASISYQAWGVQLGQDSQQRTRLTALREGASLLGILLAAALPSLLAALLPEAFGGTASVQGLVWLLWPLVLLALISLSRLPEVLESPQPVAMPVSASGVSEVSAFSVRQALRMIGRDRAFRSLLLVFVTNGIAAALPATLVLFFINDVLQASAWAGALLALYFIAGAAGLPVWVRLARRWGRVPVWLGSMLLAMLAFAGTARLGAGDVLPFALVCLASGLALGADLALPAALAADHARRLQQGGLCFGLWNFVSKLNLALAAGLSLPLLALFGYQSGTRAIQGLQALHLAYALLPLLFKLLAAGMLWHWRAVLEIPPATRLITGENPS
jgi:Na+/melibiose symporter-like transporter